MSCSVNETWEEDECVQVNQYKLLKEIGKGAYGQVFLARDMNERLFALKRFSKQRLRRVREQDINGNPITGVAKVYNEISIYEKVASIESVKCVKLHEVLDDEQSQVLYLALEYVSNGQIMYWSTSDSMYTVNPQFHDANSLWAVSEETAKEIFRQTCASVKALHENLICHRDLKPENILITDQGNVRLADFGEAVAAETLEQVFFCDTKGTYAFMAPEALSGECYDGRTADVWALGITLYAFIYGKVPFNSSTPFTLFTQIETEAVVYPFDCGAALDLLHHILEKDPAKRYDLSAIVTHPWLALS